MRRLSAELLRSFVTVADTRSFTLAAQRLNRGQSTISQHVKRIEELLGRTVLARDTHSVALTPDGEVLLELARRVLDAHERIDRFVTASELRGRLRLGVTEDFVLAGLQDVLAAFPQHHPSVDLELTVGLSVNLYDGFDAGEMDVVFAKRRPGDMRGQVAWREQLAWIGRPGIRPDSLLPVPLLLFPPPSITRALALQALEKVGRSWRIACTSDSLGGLYAAAQAGLGITAHSAQLVPPKLAIIPASRYLPELDEIEFIVIGPGQHHRTVAALISAILQGASEAQRGLVRE